MNYQKKNINITGPNKTAVFTLSDRIPINHTVSFRDVITKDTYTNINTLHGDFFCDSNIEILQIEIRNGVHRMSNNKLTVGIQNIDQLKTIMNSIFVENSREQNNNNSAMIKKLNLLVLQYAIPQVYASAESYMKYKRDITNIATPMSNPIMTTKNKQLRQHQWF
jgi:hypothetical protein|tara:strand:+ start:2762 stop:3256 length:495 start_codon:yes stop_codon:yes gene_type:complete